MKLATIGVGQAWRSALCIGEKFFEIAGAYSVYKSRVRSARPALELSMREIIEGGESVWEILKRVENFIGENLNTDLREELAPWSHPLDGCAVEPPIANPSKVWCMGANYYRHRLEMAERSQRAVEDTMRLQGFLKAPSSLAGARSPIHYPPESRRVDHEIELALVIGARGRRIAEAEAMRFVFGYMLFNDVSARDIKELDNGRMDRGKGFDTFGVCGTWILTADEVKDPHSVELRLEVNGKTRQDGSTKDLLFKIPYQIAWLSAAMTLLPGDIVSTGTPEGSGTISPGDRLEGWSPNTPLGYLSNAVVAEPLASLSHS